MGCNRALIVYYFLPTILEILTFYLLFFMRRRLQFVLFAVFEMEQQNNEKRPPKKRGRPRSYDTPKDKEDAAVQRRRQKRQRAAAETREKLPIILNESLPSVLPPRPYQTGQDSLGEGVDGAGYYNDRTEAVLTGGDGRDAELNRMEMADFLPPLSPAPPAIAEESSDGDASAFPAPVPSLPAIEEENLDDGTFPLQAPLPSLSDTVGGLSPQGPMDDAEEDDCIVVHDESVEQGVQTVAEQLTDQLYAFHGCCADCHRTAALQHSQEAREHVSLAAYVASAAGLCPDVLGAPRIASSEDNLFGQTSPATRRAIYCGVTSDDDQAQAVHICLDADEQVTDAAGVHFDMDSVTGFPSSLAVAKQGVRWFPTQMPVSDLQSDLHLRSRPVSYLDTAGKMHHVRRPVHKIPHYTLGRLIGFEEVSLYLLFPHLYREEQQSSRLREVDFR